MSIPEIEWIDTSRGLEEAWYDLFAEDGLYWVPIGDDGDDPGRAVSVAA